MTLVLNNSDAHIMQSYPDPTAVSGEGGGPFYSSSTSTNQQRPPNSDELQLAAQLSRGLEPMMSSNSDPGLHDVNDAPSTTSNHQYAPEHHLHQAIDQNNMSESPYAIDDSSTAPRKRSKVSRACDECRRKKIRCDATTETGDEQCSNCKRVSTRCQFSRVPMKRGPSKGYIKELADRLNTLEGAMQSGEIPSYVPLHHESPLRRESHDFSPPPSLDTHQPRKRTYSTISNEFGPYPPQRPASWNSADPSPRQPPAAHTGYASQPPPSEQPLTSYRPHYSPSTLAPQPSWRNGPEAPRRPSTSHDSLGPNDLEQKIEWDETMVDSFYQLVQPTFPMLPYSRSRLHSRLACVPSHLKEAFLEALYAVARSFPSGNGQQNDSSGPRKAMSMISNPLFGNDNVRNFAASLLQLQTLVMLAIEADSHGPPGNRNQHGPSQSVWLGTAVGLAYSIKLHLLKPSDAGVNSDGDSDEQVARRTWWSLVILDRYHASSTSSPLMIPETSVVLLPEDQQVFGEATYHLARLSPILGHISTVLIAPADVTSAGAKAAPIIGSLLNGEVERFRETLPPTLTPSSAPVLHLAYWHVRLLMKRAVPTSDPLELLMPVMQLAALLTPESLIMSPLSHHFTALTALTLLDLMNFDSTREEAERGIRMILESHAAPSAWDTAIRATIQKKKYGAGSGSVVNAPSQHAITASQGLRHLADLATAADASRPEALSEVRAEPSLSALSISGQAWDATLLTRGGYLGALSSL